MRIGTIGIFAFVLVLVFAFAAQGAIYLWQNPNGFNSGITEYWNNSGGQNNWNTGVGGAYPNAVDDVAVINDYNATINLSGGDYTLGTLNLETAGQWGETVANMSNGTLTFQTSSGSAQLTDNMGAPSQGWSGWMLWSIDTISANIQMNSPLTVSVAIGHDGYGYGSPGINFGLELSGVVSGSNGLTKTGEGVLWLTNTGNNFVGNLNVQDGYLYVDNAAELGSGSTLVLGGTGSIGRLLFADPNVLTRNITLTGEGGQLDSDWYQFQLNDVISGTGNLIIGQGYQTIFNNTSDNTYVGNTMIQSEVIISSGVTARVLRGNVKIQGYGSLVLNDPNNLDPTASVLVDSFAFPNYTPMISTLEVRGDFVPTIDPNSSGFLALDANMITGTLYPYGSTGPNINARLAVGAPQLGNGYMSIGCTVIPGCNGSTETFTGTSLQPDLDNVFRFMVASSAAFVLDSGGAGVLTDVGGVSTSVEVSSVMYGWSTQNVQTNNANTFSGSLTINPTTFFIGFAQSSGSPFGAATGDVNLNGGALYLSSYNPSPAPIAKNNLNLQGQAAIFLSTNGGNTADITFAAINRNNNAILAIEPYVSGTSGDVLGGTAKLIVTAGVANVDGGLMAPPYFVQYDGANFLKYDPTNGFEVAAFTATNSWGANNGTDIVNLTAGAAIPPGGASVFALRTGGALTGAGNTINIAGGGLILAVGGTYSSPVVNTANINFGSAEGVIYASTRAPSTNVGYNEFDGNLMGTSGVTFGAPLNGNSAQITIIRADNTATLSGPVTINEGLVEIATAGSLGTGTITLNGGSSNGGNCVAGALQPCSEAFGFASTIVLPNNIVLGPNGGSIGIGYGEGSFQLTGQISGPGAFTLYGHSDYQLQITNAANNWTGGTIVQGGQLVVNAGAMLGSGPIMVGGSAPGGELELEGVNDVNPNSPVGLYSGWDADDRVSLQIGATAETIGSLEGNGRLYLNAWATAGTNCVLTMGQNNLSTDYYGQIYDWGVQNVGSIVKVGTGTFTFWGDGDYCGYTTINGGTFCVNGNLNTVVDGYYVSNTVTVNNGGTLSGSGFIGRPVSVTAGGLLTGSLTIGSTVAISGTNATGGLAGAANMTNATITGSVGLSTGGTFTGVNTTIGGLTSTTNAYDTFTGTNCTINNFSSGFRGGTITGTNTINSSIGITLGFSVNANGTGIATLSGSNTINALSTYVLMENATITGSNIINTGALYLNYTYTHGATLSGSNTINGPTYLDWSSNLGIANAVVTGSNTFNGAVTMYGGSFLGNNTITTGGLTTAAGSNAIVSPHVGATASTLAIVGAVALDHTTTLNYDLGTPGTIGGGINDLITITGSLSLDGTLNVTGLTGFGAGTYTLFTYTGMLTEPSGPLTLGAMPSGMGYTYTIDTSTTGQVNLDVVMPWAPGDTNRDGALNSLDIDAIYHNFGAPSTSQWKVDGDGNVVGQGDVTYELHTYFHTNYGDANLDTKTDFSDFQVLLDHWQVAGPTIGWAQGDFNGSYTVDFLDFQTLLDYWNPGGWSFAPAQTPEPASLSLLLLGGLALLRRRK